MKTVHLMVMSLVALLVGCGNEALDSIAQPSSNEALCGVPMGDNFAPCPQEPACDPSRQNCTQPPSSCFEAETLLLTESQAGTLAWISANQIGSGTRLIALDEESTPRLPRLKPRAIKVITQDLAKSALYVFRLSNGRQLKVTPNHGMLLANGQVVAAHTLSIGARFVNTDGSIVRVEELSTEQTARNVFNFEVEAEAQKGHFIVAEGVFVGDLMWQNKLANGN
ncbi:MAG TPA: Hint domain-containing protein [Pseudomonadota bacterium]|nr:Hint domain-containing protein [Pseudomonadota bacterium]